MLRKVIGLVGAVVLVAGATGLFPVETSAAGREWNQQVSGRHDGGHHAGGVTIVTQPVPQVQIRPYYAHPHHGYHHGGFVYAPVEPVWVPAGWYWTGYQWVWVDGYWH
jgi:hypothetical protein